VAAWRVVYSQVAHNHGDVFQPAAGLLAEGPGRAAPDQPWVATLVRTIFDQPDAAEVHAQFARVVAALEAKLPAAAEHLSAAREDLLAFTAVAREIWRQVWSSNPQERLNKEPRRRTDVVGIFPGRAAIIRLVGAVLMEQNDEWAEARRYMGPDILAKTSAPAAADDASIVQEVNAIEAISA
jgi:putative transposase